MDLQLDALAQAGCEEVFTGHGKSGASANRNRLTKAVAALRQGGKTIREMAAIFRVYRKTLERALKR